MRWYLLKDRRLEGPFSPSELARSVKEQTIDFHDFVLSEANKINAPLAYESVRDVLKKHGLFERTQKALTTSSQYAAHKNSQNTFQKNNFVPPRSKESIKKDFENALENEALLTHKESPTQYHSAPTNEELSEEVQAPPLQAKSPLKFSMRSKIALLCCFFVFAAISFKVLFTPSEQNQPTSISQEIAPKKRPVQNVKRSAPQRSKRISLPTVKRREVNELSSSQNDFARREEELRRQELEEEKALQRARARARVEQRRNQNPERTISSEDEDIYDQDGDLIEPEWEDEEDFGDDDFDAEFEEEDGFYDEEDI